MTESFLYEDDDFKARSKESGKIVYYKTKDAMDAAIKDKKVEPIEKDDKKDDKPDTKKGMDIDTTGGLGGDEKPSDEPDEKDDIDINTFDGVKKHADKVEKALDLLSNDMKKFKDEEPPYNDLSNSEWEKTNDKLRDAESKLSLIIRDDPRDDDYEGNRKKGIQNKITKSYKKEVDNISSDAQEYIDKVKEPKESITFNGKKYKPIKESVNKKITVKEVKSWLKGLEEFRYRKIPSVDARRITSFVNNGLSETDLPASLQKKWGNAKYSKEKGLADRFMKERINKRLTQNESNHPLKEQYNKLFKNKVVL